MTSDSKLSRDREEAVMTNPFPANSDARMGTVYAETVVWMAPVAFTEEAPYQLAMVDLDDGRRETVRISGEGVSIGDRVEFLENRVGAAVFSKK